MRKTKFILLLIFISAISLTSCLKDEVEELQDDVAKIQSALGTNEPLVLKFNTKDGNNVDVVKNTSFLFKPGGTEEYIGDYQNGWYEIYIERFSDVNWNEGAYIDFAYNPTTKEIGSIGLNAYFYGKNGNWLSPYFYESDFSDVSITVKSFNPSTGEIVVEATGSSDAGYGNNVYYQKPMDVTMSFAGKLPVYIWVD